MVEGGLRPANFRAQKEMGGTGYLTVVGQDKGSRLGSNGGQKVKTKRPISINNSLSHGICNCNCGLCGVNKPTYRGPREFQPETVTRQLVHRIIEAAWQGVRIRYVANAGDGEPTLHPDFASRMDLFGDLIRKWDVPGIPAPEVSVVTNGLRLLEPGVLDTVVRNRLTLIVSFPTCVPESYGTLMVGDAGRGESLLAKVIPGIRQALALHGRGEISRMQFHISPPDREIVRRDFAATVDFLAAESAAAGLVQAELVLFPATSNRSGLVRNRIRGCDMYHDLFRRYNGRTIRGVRILMKRSYKRFFPGFLEFVDLLRAFDFPCTWNAQLFVTAAGESICCNDQAVRNPMGNLTDSSIVELMMKKESHLPAHTCAACDQAPDRMGGAFLAALFGRLAVLRLALARRLRSAREVTGGGLVPDSIPVIPSLEPEEE